MFKRLLILFFYCLFALVVTGVFLVVLFPRDKFLGWASAQLTRKLPGIELSAGDIKYVHPFKLRIYGLNLRDDQNRWELPVDTLLVSFEPRFPVEKIGVIGVLFGGDLRFDLGFGSHERLELGNLQISEMHLADLTMLAQSMGRPVKGILSLSGRATVDYRRPSDVRFTGKMQIANFSTPLKRPVLKETEVRFDQVSGDIVFNEGVIDVTGGRAAGLLLEGDFSGQIWGALPMGNSRFDLRGSVVPKTSLIQKHPDLADPLAAYFKRFMTDSIPYQIEGTVAEPLLTFENFE